MKKIILYVMLFLMAGFAVATTCQYKIQSNPWGVGGKEISFELAEKYNECPAQIVLYYSYYEPAPWDQGGGSPGGSGGGGGYIVKVLEEEEYTPDETASTEQEERTKIKKWATTIMLGIAAYSLLYFLLKGRKKDEPEPFKEESDTKPYEPIKEKKVKRIYGEQKEVEPDMVRSSEEVSHR